MEKPKDKFGCHFSGANLAMLFYKAHDPSSLQLTKLGWTYWPGILRDLFVSSPVLGSPACMCFYVYCGEEIQTFVREMLYQLIDLSSSLLSTYINYSYIYSNYGLR